MKQEMILLSCSNSRCPLSSKFIASAATPSKTLTSSVSFPHLVRYVDASVLCFLLPLFDKLCLFCCKILCWVPFEDFFTGIVLVVDTGMWTEKP